MTDNATPGAGGGGAAPAPAGAGMPDNTAGMVAYITIIPAIIFLVMEPYNKRPFVRFHAFQNIFFCVAWTALWIVLSIIGMLPMVGWLTLILWPIIGLGGLVLWVMLLLKANQGQMWKLPFIGDLAAKQAGV
jgi:uncharacterized membrane protein